MSDAGNVAKSLRERLGGNIATVHAIHHAVVKSREGGLHGKGVLFVRPLGQRDHVDFLEAQCLVLDRVDGCL